MCACVSVLVAAGGLQSFVLRTAVENCCPDVGKVLGEAVELGRDLLGQLVGVADADSKRLVLLQIFGASELLKGGDDKDGSLAHTSLGLAQNIKAQHGAGNALVLDSRRVLESTVGDGAQDLGLEHEVLEASIVDVGVVSLGCFGLLLLFFFRIRLVKVGKFGLRHGEEGWLVGGVFREEKEMERVLEYSKMEDRVTKKTKKNDKRTISNDYTAPKAGMGVRLKHRETLNINLVPTLSAGPETLVNNANASVSAKAKANRQSQSPKPTPKPKPKPKPKPMPKPKPTNANRHAPITNAHKQTTTHFEQKGQHLAQAANDSFNSPVYASSPMLCAIIFRDFC